MPQRHLRRIIIPFILAASLTLAAVSPLAAQVKRRAPADPATSAEETRQAERELQQALKDPRLAEENDRFNTQVAEEMLHMRQQMVRDAMNRMNQRSYNSPNHNEDIIRILSDVMAFLVFATFISTAIWFIGRFMENRRWNRVASIQTEMHSRLMEKLSSNQEILAYMETEAGKRFLESSPFDIEIDHKSNPAFPYTRILISAQAGIVVLFVGAALVWLCGQLPDYAQPLLVFGTLGMAMGAGLLISAALSYSLSRHFGLTGQANMRDSQ